MSCDSIVEAKNQASKNVLISLAVSLVAACIGTGFVTRQVEPTVIACSLAIACSIIVFFGWASWETGRSECLMQEISCERATILPDGIGYGIASMTSVLTLIAFLHMYRARSGPWKIIGMYTGIGVVAVIVTGFVMNHIYTRVVDPICQGNNVHEIPGTESQ